MNIRIVISSYILGLFFATIQAQSCQQATSFTLQTPGKPDLNLILNGDASLCTSNAVNTCDQTLVFCNMGTIAGFGQFQPSSNCGTLICAKFKLTESNGNVILQCTDTLANADVSIIGFDSSLGYVESPDGQLQAGQVAVTLKGGSNDPCGIFKPPTPPPPPPPPTGPALPPPPTPPPPPPPTTPPAPPKPMPPPPFVFTPGKAGDLCSTTIPCEKGLCCLLSKGGPLSKNTCQKCTTPAPPKPTTPKPSPTAPPDPALASALNPRTLTLFRSMGNDMFAAMSVFSPDNKKKRFLDLSKTNLHFECGKGYVTIFNETTNGLHKRLNPGPPRQTIRTIRFESYTVKNQIIQLPAQCASDHFYRANSYSYFKDRVQIFYDSDFNSAQSEGVANVHIVYSSGKQLQSEQNLDKAGSGSLWSSLKAWVQEMNTVQVDKSKSISYSNSFNQKLIEITAKCDSQTANANFDSSITLGGSFSASITFGFYGKGTLVPPNIEEAYTYSNAQANADIHLDFDLLLTGGFQKTVPVIQQAFTPLQIPGLVAIGPKLEMDITVFGKFSISAHGKISASKQFGPYYTAHHFVGSSSNPESDQSPTGSNDIQWITSIDFQADGDVGIILTPRMFLDAEITAGSKTLVKADTGAYVNLYGALAGHAQAEAIASNSQKSASASACMQVYGGANVGLYLHGQVLNENKQLNWPLWKVDKTFLKPDSKCPLTTLPQLPTVQFKKRDYLPRRLYKRNGALFNFDASSFACPKLGFKPPPTPSTGTACSLKLPSSNKKKDLLIDPKKARAKAQQFQGQVQACLSKLHKRAFKTFCDLTLQTMTPQIRSKIVEAASILGYDENYLKDLVNSKKDAQLLLHNQENIEVNNHVSSLPKGEKYDFITAYFYVHDHEQGDGDKTVSFKAIQPKVDIKIKQAKQIVSSIQGNSRVTSKNLQEDVLIEFPSLYLTDIAGQLSALGTRTKTDSKTKQQAKLTILNPNSAGSLTSQITDLFLSARNTISAALDNLKNPNFIVPDQKLIDISHSEVKNEIISILTHMIAPGTEHTFAYIDTHGILNSKDLLAEGVINSAPGSTMVFNSNFILNYAFDEHEIISTIIHEMSHTLAGTQDIEYGPDCESLFHYSGNVVSYKALQNADSIALFVMTMAQDPSNACHLP